MVEQARQSSSRPDASAPARYLDAGLLFCCMDMLQIDHNKLMRDEPLLYRELQVPKQAGLLVRSCRWIRSRSVG